MSEGMMCGRCDLDFPRCECGALFHAQAGTLGAYLIDDERRRRLRIATAASDDAYGDGELERAAIAYIWHSLVTQRADGRQCPNPPPGWPWPVESFRAEDELRVLEKAGALVAAAIDRLARLKPELLAAVERRAR